MLTIELRKKLFVDHVVFTVSNLPRTKEFYSKIFGTPDYADDYSIMYYAGETKLFFVIPYGEQLPGDKFNPNRIGLEHFAIGVKSLDDLNAIGHVLDNASIKHSGVHIDKHSRKEKIWLDDPDGIRMEFYITG